MCIESDSSFPRPRLRPPRVIPQPQAYRKHRRSTTAHPRASTHPTIEVLPITYWATDWRRIPLVTPDLATSQYNLNDAGLTGFAGNIGQGLATVFVVDEKMNVPLRSRDTKDLTGLSEPLETTVDPEDLTEAT
ncbi:hypothetical protein FRC12_007501 [Ceratobasidium sp. 428]|nr:hypothetical protein FRC12_007501 [Ceratobasidium sp. 428]